jgi:hypothetical protein
MCALQVSDTYDECVFRDDTLVLLEMTTRDMMEVWAQQPACSRCKVSEARVYLPAVLNILMHFIGVTQGGDLLDWTSDKGIQMDAFIQRIDALSTMGCVPLLHVL